MMQAVGSALMLLGAGLCLLASIGVLRMPDSFMRIHAATKAGVLGAGLVLIGAALCLGGAGALLKATIAVLLLFFAAPIAGQLLARAALRRGELQIAERTAGADTVLGSVGERAR